jgi:hypothetical protein
LRRRYPTCGFEAAPSARFCPERSQRLTPPAPAVASPATFTPSQAYTPHLAEKIRMLKSVLEGEPAATACQQAITLAEELGMRPLQAHGYLGLGILYARTGQR